MKKCISIILVFFIFCATGCIEKKVQTTSQERDYLIYNLESFPEDLAMVSSNEIREKDLLVSLFDGLVREDEKGEIIPSLAEDWSVSEDGIEYNFKLKTDIRWNNGESITSKDFKEFFKWFLGSGDNIYSEELDCIYGAKAYRKGEGKFSDVAIYDIDDTTLQIRLNTPCAYFINILSNPVYNLRKEEDLKKLHKDYEEVSYSGPFKIRTVGDGGFILEKNREYYREKEIKSENIVMKLLKDSESALVEFEAPWGSNGVAVNGSKEENKIDSKNYDSKIDLFVNPPLNEVERLRKNKEVESFDSLHSINYIFNMNKEKFQDENLRKAVSYALCKNNIIDTLAEDVAIPTMGYIPAAIGNGIGSEYGIKNSVGKEGDIETAKAYFEKTKYDLEKPLKLYYKDDFLNRNLAEEFKKDLKNALDINVKLLVYEEDELSSTLKENDYDIIQKNIFSSYNDALAFLENFTSNSSNNTFGYKNEEFDAIVSKLRIEKEPLKRKSLIEEGEAILIKDIPMIPLYNSSNVLCKREYVKGAYITKLGNINLDKAYKEVKKDKE